MSADVSSLKQAADFIRAGKLDKARPLLVEFLREEPAHAQGWYLLSFVVDDPQRKQYALAQALKADPGFERAQARLRELRGEAPLPAAEEPPAPSWLEAAQVTSGDEPPLASAPAFVESSLNLPGLAPIEQAPLPEDALRSDAADEPPPAEKKPSSLRRVLVALVLVGLLALLAVFAFNLLQPNLGGGRPQPTATQAPFRTLPPTWTPGG